jgi:peptidyl-Lys metalloendopeptidase
MAFVSFSSANVFEVSITPAVDQAVLTPAEAGQVHFNITNTTDQELSFLRYNTPLGGFDAELFSVTRDGEPVTYIGRLALRLGPTPEDWVTLEAGESIDAWIDLFEAYDMRRGGLYVVTFSYPVGFRSGGFDRTIHQSLEDTPKGEQSSQLNFEYQPIESNSYEIFVDGPDEVDDIPIPLQAFGFSGCSSSRINSLNTARSYGSSLSARSYNQLAGTSGSSNSLYRTWFGSYTSSRYNYVRGNYYDLYYSFQRTWNYTCTSCQSGVIAYVYPTYAYNVWICPSFFNYSNVERGSFLLHEASHWNAVAGTDDYGYGSSYCRSLASRYPGYAVYNADNYRYFSLGAW